MELSTATQLLAHHADLKSWTQTFMFETSAGYVNLATAIGPRARTPDNATNQPDKYLNFLRCRSKTFYRFDPDTYSGVECKDRLVNAVRASLPGASYFANNLNKCETYSTCRLICSFGKAPSQKTTYKKIPL